MIRFRIAILASFPYVAARSILLGLAIISVPSNAYARDDIRISVDPNLENQTQLIMEDFAASLDFPIPSLQVTSNETAFDDFCGGVGVETSDIVISTQRITPLQRSQCERAGVTDIGENIRFVGDEPTFIYLKLAHVGVISGLTDLFDVLVEDTDGNSSVGGGFPERVMLESKSTRITEARSPSGVPIYNIEIGLDQVIGDLNFAASSFGFQRECGESLTVKSIQPSVNRGLLTIDGTIIYDRWTCIKTKVPELQGLKMKWRTLTSKSKVVSQDYRICNGSAYTADLRGNSISLRSDHFETCREALSRSHVNPDYVIRIYSEIRQRLDAHMSKQISEINRLFENKVGEYFWEARGLSKIRAAEFRRNRSSSDVFVIIVEAVFP